jgi:hypothetical protein
MSEEVWTAHGCFTGGIRDCLEWLEAPEPAWSWAEPRPGAGILRPGQLADQSVPSDEKALPNPDALLGQLFSAGEFDLPNSIALEEARLFWSSGCLYLVEDQPGETRWAFWARKIKGDSAFEFAEKLDNRNDIDLVTERVEISQPEYRLPRTDLARFGLRSTDLFTQGQTLRILQVFSNDGLLGWTLITPMPTGGQQ